jgi:hypothetical protein
MTKNDETISVGGLYVVQGKDGFGCIMKVLAVDEIAVHLCLYANCFLEQPKDVDPAQLTLRSTNDPGGFGISHFPVAKEDFLQDNPLLIKVVPV